MEGGHYSCSLECPEIKLIFFNSRVVRSEKRDNFPSASNGLHGVSVVSSKVTWKNGVSNVESQLWLFWSVPCF